jgi:hypothetical protein
VTDRPTKISFGEMREMGSAPRVKRDIGFFLPPASHPPRPIGGIIRGSAATHAAAIRCP